MTRPHFSQPPALSAREAPFAEPFGLGEIAFFLYLALLITGIPLTFLYTPTAVSAAESIRTITYLAPYGWLLRNLQYWAAVLLLLTGMLHLLRVVLTGGYRPPHRLNWLVGLALLLLSLLLSFSGYVLRWDVVTMGALTIVMNIVQQTPLLGSWLYDLLVGGPNIGDTTLSYFYTGHTVGLHLPLLLLPGWYALRARRHSGTRWKQGNWQWPILRSPIPRLALFCLLMALALWLDAPLGWAQ